MPPIAAKPLDDIPPILTGASQLNQVSAYLTARANRALTAVRGR